jgi:adenylate kinase family enzyme
VPLLGPGDPLPARPRRALVAGAPGSGKTTIGRLLASTLGVPHIEIDALFHGPGWVPRPQFESDVRAFAATEGWVTEWLYAAVRELLVDQADLMVWLDLPRWTVMRQVIARTISRRRRREILWNGNIEPPLHTFFTDRDHIVRWAWRTYPHTRLRVGAVMRRRPELVVVRLRSREHCDAWLARVLSAVAGL